MTPPPLVFAGSGSFQTGPGYELSSSAQTVCRHSVSPLLPLRSRSFWLPSTHPPTLPLSRKQSPRGFVGYFSFAGPLELMWAQQLGDDRLSDESPAIGAIADSTSCSAVVAGES